MPGTADKMKSAKAVWAKATWAKATPGHNKDAALNHDRAAQRAQNARNEAECNREPDAAKRALA